MSTNPGSNADRSKDEAIKFGALWQTGHYIMENNLIDCYRTDSPSPFAARGAVLLGYKLTPMYVFPQWIAKENVIRHTDHVASAPTSQGHMSAAFQTVSVEYSTVQENIIDVTDPNPIHRFEVRSMKCFNNRTAAGKLLRGYDQKSANTDKRDSELEDLIETAMALSL